MHSAHPGLSSDYCEEDFFFLYFLIVGLLHLVIEHYIEEKRGEEKIFLSLFVYTWIFLSDYCDMGGVKHAKIRRLGFFMIIISVNFREFLLM